MFVIKTLDFDVKNRQKTPEIDKNDQKGPKMAKNGPKKPCFLKICRKKPLLYLMFRKRFDYKKGVPGGFSHYMAILGPFLTPRTTRIFAKTRKTMKKANFKGF